MRLIEDPRRRHRRGDGAVVRLRVGRAYRGRGRRSLLLLLLGTYAARLRGRDGRGGVVVSVCEHQGGCGGGVLLLSGGRVRGVVHDGGDVLVFVLHDDDGGIFELVAADALVTSGWVALVLGCNEGDK